VAVSDFVHDEEIVEAVLAQLRANLPPEWTTDENTVLSLKWIEFGDLRDYRLGQGESYGDLCPLIYVRLNRSDAAPEYGGLGGKEGQIVPLRLVHVRPREQWPEADGNLPTPPARIRARCAKIISKALFANRDLGSPALTTDDSSARVVELRPKAIVYEAERGEVELAARHDLVAFAIDFEVVVRTQ